MTPCDSIISQMLATLSEQFSTTTAGGGCYLATPFLFPDNTPISLSIRLADDGMVEISDYGQSSDYAFVHGVTDVTVRKRLAFVARRFGATVDGGEISKLVPVDQAAEASISIIMGAQDVAYLTYRTTRKHARETFTYDVEAFLASRGRSFRKTAVLPGASGSRTFDYIVRGDFNQLALSLFEPRSEQSAESRAKRLAFDFMDVKNTAVANLDFAVLIDTRSGKGVNERVLSILNEYIPHVIQWDERHRLDQILNAA